MNTPDTEWREVRDKVGYTLNIGENHTYIENRLTSEEMQGIKNLIDHSISSRDTYWKERVREEVEEMAGKTVWNAEGKPHISAPDLLQALDNLK